MKKYFLVTILIFCGKNIRAQQLDSIFENPAIQEINRLPMRASYFPFEEVSKAQTSNLTTSARFLNLNGQWSFLWRQEKRGLGMH